MRCRQSLFQRGQILILAAVSLIILIGFVGLAIDAGRGYGVKAKLNSAVDAAAIGAARGLADGATDAIRIANAKQAAKDLYGANFPAGYLGATADPLTDSMIVATHEASGYWTVTVTGGATMPLTFMGIFGLARPMVGATGTTIRRDLDVILVLDTSGSLGTPADTLPKLKAAAINFVNMFNAGTTGDRVGVVSFASGAVVDVPIDKTGARGFNKTLVVNAINALSVVGSTTAAEGLRQALIEINGVPPTKRSSQRAIVFFSDGAPNGVPATFRNGTTDVTGDLYSETSGPSTMVATIIYCFNQRYAPLVAPSNVRGKYFDIASLPTSSGVAVLGQPDVPLASYNGKRTFSDAAVTNNVCNVNKAARNMVENVANLARSQGITIHSIGLGERVNSLEITFCDYGTNEYGSAILKRLANAADSDTRSATQPTGLYVWAESASDLANAFATIASEILRLSQ
jgi:Flp pilus assembly protein TadG